VALDLPLDRLQRWMQAVVTHPGRVEDGMAAAEAAHEVDPERLSDVVLPSRTLEPAERLDIYHEMYPLRMHDALATDYEALRHFLGDRLFRELVASYVQAHPSRSHTLNRLADKLPAFLETTPGIRRRGFCVDLARLELAMTRAFDAEEAPSLTAAEIDAVPETAWEGVRIEMIPAFRLLSFRHPVNAYLQSVKDGRHEHPRTGRKNTWVAVYRRNYAVCRLDLSKAAHDLLADLASGVSLGDAVARALGVRGRSRKRPEETDIFRWFRGWAAEGFFRAVRTPGERSA
jgi:hypothetical protein